MSCRDELLEGPPPSTTTAWLLGLALFLAAGLVLFPRGRPDRILDWLPHQEGGDTNRIARVLGSVADLEEQGRPSESWELLQELHAEHLRHPQVNLALARHHHDRAADLHRSEAKARRVRLDFAFGYVDLALEVRPDWPAAEALRARICLDAAGERLRRAGGELRPSSRDEAPRPERALALLTEAGGWLERVRASLPAAGSEGVDPATREALAVDLADLSARREYETAVAREIRGRGEDRAEARATYRRLSEDGEVPENLRREAATRLERLGGSRIPSLGGVGDG